MLDSRIETFLTVCRVMNYTKAAEKLHISQPAVSQHIHWLEERYSVPLFVYEGRKLRLTEEGRLLHNAASAMASDERALKAQLQHNAKERFVFGATLTIGNFVLPARIEQFLRKCPLAEITMRVDNTESLLQALDAGTIDFAVLEGYFRKSMYAYEVYSNERFICVCKADYRFVAEPQTLNDLFSEQLILRESGSGSREILERQLMEQNFSIQDFHRLLQIGSIHAIISLVCAGSGITFLYEAAVREELENSVLRRIDLSDFQVEHPFTIVWRKNSLFDAEYRKQFSALLFE